MTMFWMELRYPHHHGIRLRVLGTQSRTVTVLDAESVGVNILAGSISEAAGVRATQAEIFRTDTRWSVFVCRAAPVSLQQYLSDNPG